MKRWLNTVLLIFFSIVFVVSLWFLVDYYLESREQKDVYDNLADLVDQNRPNADTKPSAPSNSDDPTNPDNPDNPDAPTEPSENVDATDPTEPPVIEILNTATGEMVPILPEYTQIYTMNPDTIGWIRIDGTVINYPVMQTPDRPNYYLKRNFERASSSHGCLYAGEAYDVMMPSDNITIYGHNMRDGSMFASLLKYKSKDYWRSHPFIYFDTITERHTYEIMAVFTTTVSIGHGFDYHNFVNAKDEAAFNKFVSDCKLLSLYNTNVEAEYGDKFITLSTCEYSQTNGRMVVVAKRIY